MIGAVRRRAAVAILVALLAAAPAALAAGSLYSGSGPRPGPALLYAKPTVAPQLSNAGVWRAQPILVSGATAYQRGEFLYQDYLYDDHGARELPDPNDSKAANQADLFSKSNGTYTYPTGPGYDNDAADLVEFRVKPLRTQTAFRITLNTLVNPKLIAFSIAIGGRAGHAFAFPDGANVRAPANLFLTVHPGKRGMVGDLVRAANGRKVKGPAVSVHVDLRRSQIVVRVPHKDWNPRRATVRLAMGVGLWDGSAGRYLLPQASADATHPGGAGTASHPAAFFNVAFRTHEPPPAVGSNTAFLIDPAWWRDSQQGTALAAGDISPFFANVSFAKLARRKTDNSKIPRTGPIDRILSSRFQTGPGAQFSNQCGLNGATTPASCVPEYRGRLQPYAIYVPPGARPKGGYGMTLLLHSLSANYNQYTASRNQSQFGRRPVSSIVITPEARGPDQFYEGLGEADVFEVWADVARRYRLNPAYTEITGYSMGGIGTFKLAEQFPDLFARAQPTVGDESNNDAVASLRNIPVLMWNNAGDELVSPAEYEQTANKLDSLGYRYELDVFQPCESSPSPQKCSPAFPSHLELAVNDQFAPAAAFLGTATVNRNPAHVTYLEDAERNRPGLELVADHAYWISGLTFNSQSHTSSNGDPEGEIDALSHGFGTGDPAASSTQIGHGALTGGNLGPLQYASQSKTWGATPSAARSDTIDINAVNIATASINVKRAHVDCNVTLNVTTATPLTIALPGCGRTFHATPSSSSPLPPVGIPPLPPLP
jgi:glucodextranase-like protein